MPLIRVLFKMDKLELPAEDLLLDLKNPRIGQVNSQSEALAAIVSLNLDHFRTMMRSIRDHGLDPGDSFYIINQDDGISGYTVVDGNRRLAALKVLTDPTILQGTPLTSATIKKLISTASGFDPKKIPLVDCVLFDSRKTANEWIHRRHGRGLEGEGRIAWNPLEIQRFQGDWTVLDILNFVERNSTFSEDEWQSIRNAVYNNSSTLSRFIDSEIGRKWLSLEVLDKSGEKIPAFRSNELFVLSVLSQIFFDIQSEKITSRSYNKSSEIEEYFNSLPEDLHPNKEAMEKSKEKQRLFRDVTIADTVERPRVNMKPGSSKEKTAEKPKEPSTAKTKTTKPKPPRATLAPQRQPFAQPETVKGQELVREASSINLANMPLASAYILRAFLEHTIDSYMTTHKIPFWEGGDQLNFSVRAERVITHIEKNGGALAKDLKGVKRTLTSKSDPASIQALNDYHHNKYQIPGVDILRDAWDSAEPLFIAVYGAP